MKENTARSRIRSPEVVVPVIGLAYTDLYFVYLFLSILAQGQFPGFLLMLVPFLAVFAIGAFGIWRNSRLGYVISAIITAFFLAFFGSLILDSFGNPADFAMFFGVITVVSALTASFVYSVIGLRTVWRRPLQMMPRAMVPRSSLIAILILGFVFGGLAVGLAAGGTQARLLS